MDDVEKRLAALESLADAATSGKWTWEESSHMDLGDAGQWFVHTLYAGRTEGHHGLNLFGRLRPDANGIANLNFICAARDAIPELVDLARRLIWERDEALDWLARLANDHDAYEAGRQAGRQEVMNTLKPGERYKVEALLSQLPVPLPPLHQRTIERLRMLEDAIAEILLFGREDGSNAEHRLSICLGIATRSVPRQLEGYS